MLWCLSHISRRQRCNVWWCLHVLGCKQRPPLPGACLLPPAQMQLARGTLRQWSVRLTHLSRPLTCSPRAHCRSMREHNCGQRSSRVPAHGAKLLEVGPRGPLLGQVLSLFAVLLSHCSQAQRTLVNTHAHSVCVGSQILPRRTVQPEVSASGDQRSVLGFSSSYLLQYVPAPKSDTHGHRITPILHREIEPLPLPPWAGLKMRSPAENDVRRSALFFPSSPLPTLRNAKTMLANGRSRPFSAGESNPALPRQSRRAPWRLVLERRIY